MTPAPLTITADDKTKSYAAALPTLTASYSGFVNGDTAASLTTPLTLSTTADAKSHVSGSPYPITASGAVDPNYTISYVPGNLEITPVPLVITPNEQTKPYGAAVPPLTVGYAGFVNGDNQNSLSSPPALTTSASAKSHVSGNPYLIIASGAVDPDYTVTYVAGDLTVTPAPLTITADDKSMDYGGAVPALTARYSGFIDGDTAANLTTPPTLTAPATATAHVAQSPYIITATGAVDPDYSITYVPGKLTVAPVPLTITADDKSKLYGAAMPALTASYAGLVNGDTADSLTTQPTVSTAATASSNVSGSPYAITASGAVDADYVISYVPGDLTVTPAPLTVTGSGTQVYGGTPTFVATYSPFVLGQDSGVLGGTLAFATTTSSNSDVGTYPNAVTPSGLTSTNYAISFAKGDMVVTPGISQAPAIASANSTTFAAGAAATFTIATTGAPTAAISETGVLPAGVTLTDNGDGTATLASTSATAAGVYQFTIDASNGVGPDATQAFTLTVAAASQTTVTLSIPSVTATAGSIVTVPINLSDGADNLSGSGEIGDVQVVLRWDPSVLTEKTPSLGSLLSGWSFTPAHPTIPTGRSIY